MARLKRYFQKTFESPQKTQLALRSASGWIVLLGVGIIYRSILILGRGTTSSDTLSGVVGLLIGSYLVILYGGIYFTSFFQQQEKKK